MDVQDYYWQSLAIGYGIICLVLILAQLVDSAEKKNAKRTVVQGQIVIAVLLTVGIGVLFLGIGKVATSVIQLFT